MKNLKINILILIGVVGLSAVAMASVPAAKEIIFRKHSNSPSDTAFLNRYIRETFIHISKLYQSSLSSELKDKEVLYLKSYIDTAELICVEKNIEFPASLNLARAEYFFLTNDFRNASQEATLAIKKAKNKSESEVLANAMNFLGRYSLRTGFYMESISYFQNSIAISEKNKLRGLIPRNYYSLKDVYEKLGNHKEYRSTLYKLINAAYKENDTSYIEIAHFMFGTYLIEKEREFKLADSLLKKSLEISLIKKDTFFITRSLANIGYNYYLEKDFDSSIKSYNRSLAYSIPAKIYSNSANSLGNLGTIYRDLGDMDKSIDYYRKSIDQAKLVDDVYNLQWVYMDMSEMYLRKKDTANAYKTYVLFKKYSDMLLKQSNTQGMTDARIRYEADSHNKEVELLSLSLYNQRLLIYGSSGLFVLSLAVLVLLLSRAKINAKRRISEMNRKISEITQANLRQQMNPHFIFNTLNSIQYYMYQHDKLATNNYLTKFSSLMRKVLENSLHTSVPLRDELDA